MSDLAAVRAIVFDVFGTVVDWRSSVLRELETIGHAQGVAADWERVVDGWRAGYQPAMQRVREGSRPWTNIDDLHRMILDAVLAEHGITGFDEAARRHLTLAWHRLDPWPDAVAGLARLKRRYVIGTLSNGSVGLLVNLAKRVGLPWDMVFSAELVRHYKPDREVYRMVPELLGLAPEAVMLVAAHEGDLKAASRHGLRTGYVSRPFEHGPAARHAAVATDQFDVAAQDFAQLATLLDA